MLRNLKLQVTGRLLDFPALDNDAEGPVREILIRLRAELAVEIDYSIELELMISAVRYLALRFALGNYITIIDDNEFPSRSWLN